MISQDAADLTAQPAATLAVPRGVSGRQRELYLSLTDEQKTVYRYNFVTCGRHAQTCYRIAIGELSL